MINTFRCQLGLLACLFFGGCGDQAQFAGGGDTLEKPPKIESSDSDVIEEPNEEPEPEYAPSVLPMGQSTDQPEENSNPDPVQPSPSPPPSLELVKNDYSWRLPCSSAILTSDQEELIGAGPFSLNEKEVASLSVSVETCQPTQGERDILFIIDTSGSMGGFGGTDPKKRRNLWTKKRH